jgi:hypothetical protein
MGLLLYQIDTAYMITPLDPGSVRLRRGYDIRIIRTDAFRTLTLIAVYRAFGTVQGWAFGTLTLIAIYRTFGTVKFWARALGTIRLWYRTRQVYFPLNFQPTLLETVLKQVLQRCNYIAAIPLVVEYMAEYNPDVQWGWTGIIADNLELVQDSVDAAFPALVFIKLLPSNRLNVVGFIVKYRIGLVG